MDRGAVATMPHPAGNANPRCGRTFSASIFHNRLGYLTLFSISPDSFGPAVSAESRTWPVCRHRVPDSSKALAEPPAKVELAPMLPGFRFLFVAIMLTLSILICGLGAAALLRVAHEDFASNPSWHAAHETAFAQQGEATGPVLAMLRVDTPTVEKSSDEVSAAAEVPEQAAVVPTPTKSEKVAALNPADSPWSEPAKPEIPVAESPARSEAAPALAYAPAPADET